MVGHGGSSAGSYLANPTSPIPSHCASIVAPSTLRVYCILSLNKCPISGCWKFGSNMLTLKVLVTTIDAQWEGMGDVGLARYEPALLPPCPTIRVLSYSN